MEKIRIKLCMRLEHRTKICLRQQYQEKKRFIVDFFNHSYVKNYKKIYV